MKKTIVKGIAVASLMTLIVAVPALAQESGVNLQNDPGDNVEPGTNRVVGDDSPDCANAADVLESGLCAPGSSLNSDPSTQTDPDNMAGSEAPVGSASASASASPAAGTSASASAPAVSAPSTDQYGASASPAPALPSTGGSSLLALGVGALLVAGGLIGRRLFR